MPCYLSVSSTLSDVIQLLFMLLVFVVVLVAACYTTKFLVKTGYIQSKTTNIEVMENYRIAPNKSIQIVKIGTKYIAVAVGKEEVTFLTELSQEELEFQKADPVNAPAFTEVFSNMLKKKKSK